MERCPVDPIEEVEATVTTIEVAPALLDWAVSRGTTPLGVVHEKFPRFEGWRRGEGQPTLRQLEKFARATNTPVGFLLLDEPPTEDVPMADFRVRGVETSPHRSANLLDQVYLCEQRQAWYIDYATNLGLDEVGFIGSLAVETDPHEAASRVRADLGITASFGRTQRTWSDALSALAQHIEATGVLVMISGVVGSNTHRPLDPEEFSGFSLSDSHGPVIFVNGVDSKAAQVFTLIHELAHLYLGDSALSKVTPGSLDTPGHEEWCNAVAAEMLVDSELLRSAVPQLGPFPDQLNDLARLFKVSTLVILRRMLETGILEHEAFFTAYEDERARLTSIPRRPAEPGGSFYNTAPVRASKRFTRSILQSTLEGQTLYRDAFSLIGTSKSSAIHGLAEHLGVHN